MRYRTLGKTGLKPSVIGVGTWQFGGEWGRERAWIKRFYFTSAAHRELDKLSHVEEALEATVGS